MSDILLWCVYIIIIGVAIPIVFRVILFFGAGLLLILGFIYEKFKTYKSKGK